MMGNSFIQSTLAEYPSCIRHRKDLKDLFALTFCFLGFFFLVSVVDVVVVVAVLP